MARIPTARVALVATALVLTSCDTTDGAGGTLRGAPGAASPARDTLVVFLAASLTRPMQPILDAFAARDGAVVQRESGGSLEHARKLTELHRVPDVIALADEEVFAQLLVPEHVRWYAAFASDRMVVAYTERSRLAREITSTNWTEILTRAGVEVGRSDPDAAPAGYRTLLMFRLAQQHYGHPELAARLLANARPRNVRPNAAELAALLRSGDLDYIYEYESVARANRFRFLRLPPEVDLGDEGQSSRYARAVVRVRGRGRGDSVSIAGRPIRLAVAIPKDAPHRRAAERFVALMLGEEGRRLLRAGFVDVLHPVRFVGIGIPDSIRAAGGS